MGAKPPLNLVQRVFKPQRVLKKKKLSPYGQIPEYAPAYGIFREIIQY